MSENKTQKKKTRRKQNPAKTKTSERKISTPKSDTSNGVIPKNFGDLIKSVYFSVPTRPAWIGLIVAIGLLIIFGEGAINVMSLIIGFSVCISGFLAIQRKEYPNIRI